MYAAAIVPVRVPSTGVGPVGTHAFCSSNAKDCPTSIRFSEDYKRICKGLNIQMGKYLSVEFAEWLHGFPVGWTSAQPLPDVVRPEGQILTGCSMPPT